MAEGLYIIAANQKTGDAEMMKTIDAFRYELE
jgi:hypothetical protein